MNIQLGRLLLRVTRTGFSRMGQKERAEGTPSPLPPSPPPPQGSDEGTFTSRLYRTQVYLNAVKKIKTELENLKLHTEDNSFPGRFPWLGGGGGGRETNTIWTSPFISIALGFF